MIGHGDRFIEEKVRRLVKRELNKNGAEEGDGDKIANANGVALLRFTGQFPFIPFGVDNSQYSAPRIHEQCEVHFLGTAGIGVESQTATHIEMIQLKINDYKDSVSKRNYYPLGLCVNTQINTGARAKVSILSGGKQSEKNDYLNANIHSHLYLSGRVYVETPSGKILDTGLNIMSGTSSDALFGKVLENLGVITQAGSYGVISLSGSLNMETVRELGYTEGSLFPLQLAHCWIFSPHIAAEDFGKVIAATRSADPIWGGSLGTTITRNERG